MDVVDHNRKAWDAESSGGESEWTRPVDADVIARARSGDFSVILTPNKSVPADWLGDVRGKRILCLASGGGQQVPILAAAGAEITSFDNSPEQLARDREVAERDGLVLRLEQGDMADLSRFEPASFDMIFNPVSTVFVPDVEAVWRESVRVLAPGGALMTGCMNPVFYLFDHDAVDAGGPLEVRYRLPYADTTHLSGAALACRVKKDWPLEFSHSLDAILGGMLRVGLSIDGFYEDNWSDEATRLNPYFPVNFAVLARRPG